MLYDTPKGFAQWSVEARMEWHEIRINREAPVFEMLEKTQLYTCFGVAEIKARLFRVQWWLKTVANAIEMQDSSEYKETKFNLDHAVVKAREIGKRRSMIMLQAFKAEVKGYREQMASLKETQTVLMETVSCLESELLRICMSYEVPPEPYMVYDQLKEQL